MKRSWVTEDKVPAIVAEKTDPRILTNYIEKRKLLDKTFNRLTIDNIEIRIREQGKYKSLRYYAHCSCSCKGKTGHAGVAVVAVENLISGNSKSCGCQNEESSRAKAKFTKTDKVILQRLRAISNMATKGGPKICKRWDHKEVGTKKAVENVLADMGEPPSLDKHVMYRKDDTKPYSPENCEWRLRFDVGTKKKNIGWKNGNWKADDKRYAREYSRVWGMNDRCYNPKNQAYVDYGKRGIGVCNRWRFDKVGDMAVINFIADIGYPPSRFHSIDRKENDKGYSKANCQWSTEIEQANNRRSNVYVVYNGRKMTRSNAAAEMAEEWGITVKSIRDKWVANPAKSAAWILRWVRYRKLHGAK